MKAKPRARLHSESVDVAAYMLELGKAARAAARELARAGTEAKNKASTSVYETEKMLKEHGDKLDAGSKSAIEAAMEKVKAAEKGEDAAEINSAVEALQQASYAMAQHMYGQAGATPGGPEAAGGPSTDGQKSDEGVIDAEFERKG